MSEHTGNHRASQPVSSLSPPPEASPTVELPGLCNLEMCNLGLEQAIEMEKASLATFVSLSSYAIDLSRSASLFYPVTFSFLSGDFFDTANKLCASFVDLQMLWLNLLIPQSAPADAGSHGQVQAKAKTLEHGMDVVVGASAGGHS